jgi:multidrug efflux pump subunit AcrA (membrane-fusion protein)
VAIVAALIVVAASLAGYYHGSWRHGSGFSAAYEALPNSQAIAVLEAKRQEIIDLTAASQTMSTMGNPKLVAPSKVVAAAKAKAEAAEAQAEAAASASAAAAAAAADQAGSSTGTSTDTDTASGELSPSQAQTVAQELMPSYGFSVSSQFTCLLDLWNRESGWEWDAENASGAYGVPQSLPASKMASAGSDYLTDATTQIKWGLGYIQSTYGSPCAAWDFEEANGFY